MPSVKCLRCHLCGVWSWTVSRAFEGCPLCLPCYVDVLEERQWAESGTVRGWTGAEPKVEVLREGPDEHPAPEPYRQLDLFD